YVRVLCAQKYNRLENSNLIDKKIKWFNNLKKHTKDLDEDDISLLEQVDDLKNELQQVKNTLNELRNDAERRNNEIKIYNFKSDLNAINIKYTNFVKDYEREIQQKDKIESDLLNQVDLLKNHIDELESSLDHSHVKRNNQKSDAHIDEQVEISDNAFNRPPLPSTDL
ncbi:25391_t:CDS:2, partial [Racocetra persica]